MDGDGDQDLLNAGLGSKNVVWYENPLKGWESGLAPISQSALENVKACDLVSRDQ